ncbi:unnamed protein product [Rotaria sp. Silwood2]|nr:unnamed protein product [Rotaria sp. Silwood2]CAF4247938.1 unnamed protein product [Rotaria sp. Silwood2]
MKETTPITKIYEEEVVASQMRPQTLAIIPLARELQPGLTYARRKMTPILPDSCIFYIPDSYRTTLPDLFFIAGFPCAFCILPNRKKYTYLEMFKELKNLATQLNRTFEPARILTDYEPSIIRAISAEFPNTTHSGCYFHLTQAIYRRVQNLGLAKNYIEDIDIRTCVRKLMALALLPLDKVQLAFDDLRTNLSQNTTQTLYQLLLYFDNQWMKNTLLALWNVHGYSHRTNNICEGFHNRLNQRLQRSHPNIWSFIKCLQSEEAKFRHTLLQINAGAQGRSKTAATTAIQQRINTLNECYTNNEIDLNALLDGLSLTVAKQSK